MFKLFSIFQSFYNEVKNQFGISIQTLRSDNDRVLFNILWLLVAFFIKSHVLIDLKKWGG